MRDDRRYLEHIASSLALIEEYLAGADGALSEQLFLSDRRTQDAVLRRLETLSDAAGQLSEELQARHPEIPWRQIGGFRNVLAHGYTDIRLDRVWEVVTADLPHLKAAVVTELEGAT